MNWNTAQIERYRTLAEASANHSIRDTAALCFDDSKFFPPVLPTAFAAAESALGCALPDDLKSLYLQTDGVSAHCGASLVMPLQQAVAENQTLRSSPRLRDLYMPFDHLLVFGKPGNGDLFFFPIRADGSLAKKVFIWDHESDSRSIYAYSLKDLFLRHATYLS